MEWNRPDRMGRMAKAVGMAWTSMLVVMFGLTGCDRSSDQRPTSMRGQAPASVEEPPEVIPLNPAPGTVHNGATTTPGTTEADPNAGAASGTRAGTEGAAEDPVAVPEVTLLQRDLAGCPVKIGDSLPDASLPTIATRDETSDVKGAADGSLHARYGTKATVVLLWTPDDAWSVQGIQLLDGVVRTEFGAAVESKELGLIGIAGAATAESADAAVVADSLRFPVLLDTDGAWYTKVADKPYRLFLLDTAGKIAWFDLECSESTLRDLTTGIRALLKQTSQERL